MIVATPLDLPKIIPDDWDVFWDIWNTQSSNLVKTKQNTAFSKADVGASKVWRGMDIYSSGYIKTAWSAPLVDISSELPNLYNTCSTLPFDGVFRVRLISSSAPIPAHTDDNLDRWSIRAYFHYTDTKDQWYFTRPHDLNGERHYFHVPDETNWFAYSDKHCWHGTDYDPEHPKILLQVYSVAHNKQLLANNADKYKDYLIEI